ncbi:MAG: gluconate 2-dehydrogenase subunit 3 family protein [Planctomycetota bacterium]
MSRTPPRPPASSRRAFLGQAVATATVGLLWLDSLVDPSRPLRIRPTAPPQAPKSLTPAEWNTLEVVVDLLLPSAPGSPGARDVNAIGYVDAVLADPDVEEDTTERIRRAAAQLDDAAREQGAKDFRALPASEQAQALHGFRKTWEDELALRTLLAFTMEAFLGDPVDGVNPEAIGWTWAKIRPGYPRPQPAWKPRGEGPEEAK